MLRAPRDEILVLGEHRFEELIQHVIGRLSEKVGVGEQELVVLDIQSRDVSDNLLASRARFDERHRTSVNGLTETHHPPISRHAARQNGGGKRAQFRGGIHAQKREPQDIDTDEAAVA
jgi:hypothetical protein